MPGYVAPAMPEDEDARLAELRALDILDTSDEPEFDAIVRLAAQICETPIALVSLIDADRQWFKAKVGLGAEQTPRDVSYCGHAILGDGLFEVPEAGEDDRFRENPLRTGEPHVEFYAGVPLRTASGRKLGTLCVIDHKARTLSDDQRRALDALAAQTVTLFELRRTARLHRETVAELETQDADLREGVTLDAAGRTTLWLAGLVIVLVVATTLGASYFVRSSIEATERARLGRVTHQIERGIEDRCAEYGEILRGAAALFRASDYVSRAEFASYIDALALERNYPGLLGIGYVQQVRGTDLEAFSSAARSEDPMFEVHPSVVAGTHYVVRYLHPEAPNRPAIGLDFTSQPSRVRAVLESLRLRDVTLSERVELVQVRDAGPGFLLVLPLGIPAPVSEHDSARSASNAWVYAVFEAREMLAFARPPTSVDADYAVRDGTSARGSLLGDYDRVASSPSALERPLDIAGRSWDLAVAPSERFATMAERSEPITILVLGLSTAGLAAALVWSVGRTQRRATQLANRMTSALRRGERTLRDVVDGTADFILTIDARGDLRFTNRALRETLSFTESTTTGMNIDQLLAPEARASFDELLDRLRAGEDPPDRVHTTFRSRDSRDIEAEGVVSAVRDGGDVVIRAIFRDVTARNEAEDALRAANAELARLAANDGLTGLPNRRAFDARLAEERARALRLGLPLAVILLDVDHFKKFNDAYGHVAGDECLRRVAECLKHACRRAGEMPARYGGEEFAILVPGSDAASAARFAEIVRLSIEAMRIPHSHNPGYVVTASFGVAELHASGAATDAELVERADAALYESKHGGRNRVSLPTV